MTTVERIKCSVWTNGKNGWGVRVLGGADVRRAHFRPDISPIAVEVDGADQQFNVNKRSFWTRSCGELIGKSLGEWKQRHGLKSGEHVWLRIIEPYRRFRIEIS